MDKVESLQRSFERHEGTVIDITERVVADMRLRQSQALYKTLVDNCRDGVFLAQDRRMLFANKALADMLGYPPEQLPRDYMDFIAPESYAAQLERLTEREGGSRDMYESEVMMLCADGSKRLMQVTSVAVDYEGRIASTGTIHDITDARRRQEAIAAGERKYRTLFRNSVTGSRRSVGISLGWASATRAGRSRRCGPGSTSSARSR